MFVEIGPNPKHEKATLILAEIITELKHTILGTEIRGTGEHLKGNKTVTGLAIGKKDDLQWKDLTRM